MPYINILVNEHTDLSISAQATSYAFFRNSIGSFVPPHASRCWVPSPASPASPWKSLNMGAGFMA